MNNPDWKHIILGVLAGIIATAAIAFSIWWQYGHTPDKGTQDASVAATAAPEVHGQTASPVKMNSPTVQSYRPAAKADLKLPTSIVNDQAQHVIAASAVAPDDHPQTVATVLNTDTGEVKTFVKEEPLPWFAWNFHGDAGAYVGLKNGERAARIEVRQGVAQVKAIHFGGIASADQPLSGPLKADTFLGVGAWVRW